jgi:hypothetical protein
MGLFALSQNFTHIHTHTHTHFLLPSRRLNFLAKKSTRRIGFSGHHSESAVDTRPKGFHPFSFDGTSFSTMTMSLRSSRPQHFPRLESLDIPSRGLESGEEEEEYLYEEEEEEYEYDLYQSPCLQMASNEEISQERIANFDVCDTSFYGGCFEDVAAVEKMNKEEDLYEMTIYFDYELWYKDGTAPRRTIQRLEATMLDHLAAVLGLKTCERRVQDSQGEYAHELTDDELDRFIGLSSTPLDFKDADFGKNAANMATLC